MMKYFYNLTKNGLSLLITYFYKLILLLYEINEQFILKRSLTSRVISVHVPLRIFHINCWAR